jgi:hypothetical protein
MQKLGREQRRGNAVACLSAVMPAKAGIQYAAASRLKHRCLWNTGSSAFADDDIGGGVFENTGRCEDADCRLTPIFPIRSPSDLKPK